MSILKRPKCTRCSNSDTVVIRAVKAMNGRAMLCWYCEDCQNHALKRDIWLKRFAVWQTLEYWKKLGFIEKLPSSVDDIPIVRDHTNFHVCYICGSPSTELHHFFPQKFRDCIDVGPDWGRSGGKGWGDCAVYLCPHHHMVWHKYVAPLAELARVKVGAYD